MSGHLKPFACGRCDGCATGDFQQCTRPLGGCRCAECLHLAAVDDETPPAPPTWRCPHCQRVLDDAGWQCLPWLQFAGAIRSGRLWVAVEVRRCNCSNPVGREVALPLLEVR
jgi:hypothetical protein